jgi:hypothetical protein
MEFSYIVRRRSGAGSTIPRSPGALDYTILLYTTLGRRLLLDLVLEPGRDLEVRSKALRLLKRDRSGVEVLLRACEDPAHRRIIGQLYGPDKYGLGVVRTLPMQLDVSGLPPNLAEVKNPDDPRAELIQLRDCWDAVLGPWTWDVVIRALNPGTWAWMGTRMLRRGKGPADAKRAEQEAIAAYLAAARELTGRGDLSTQTEWDQWYRETQPKPIPRARWYERMLAHPELIKFSQYHDDFFTPRQSLAPEMVQAHIKLARAAPAGAHWRLGLTLVLYCERTQEAPLLFDDIEHEVHDRPGRFAERNPWPILILNYRFGVNYFWDVAAWRRWWAEHQAKRSSTLSPAYHRPKRPP